MALRVVSVAFLGHLWLCWLNGQNRLPAVVLFHKDIYKAINITRYYNILSSELLSDLGLFGGRFGPCFGINDGSYHVRLAPSVIFDDVNLKIVTIQQLVADYEKTLIRMQSVMTDELRSEIVVSRPVLATFIVSVYAGEL